MKLDISTKEILDFLDGGDVTAIKSKLAGALLSSVDSKEVTEALQKRVEAKIDEFLKQALEVKVSSWPKTEYRLTGWAAETFQGIMKAYLDGLSLNTVLSRQVKEYMDENLDKKIKQYVDSQAYKEMLALAVAEVATNHVQSLIQTEVKKSLAQAYHSFK